ncbi:cupin domain-containing protein [Celeribacter sp.]|uniref:cupin domain-containing protein n=1 Tax=Celeribacter sp. TaxID=1890673 RepID=UPI003A9427A2
MTYVRTYPAVTVDEHVTRQVLSENDALMVVRFDFAKGGVGALHSHPHVQSTYVESGRFRFSIAGEEFEVTAGDSFVIPSNAEHGCTCLEAGRLVDTFTPRRDDFL